MPVDAEPRSHRLPTTVTPRHYDLTLAPDLVDATFSGTASIEVDVHEPVATVHLHALDLVVTQARVEQAGRSLAAIVHLDETTEQAVLSLDTDLDLGPAVVHLEFSGTLNDKLVGFYRSTFTDHEGRSRTLACTQFESTHARRAFPCWDEPAFKATFSITLEVADDLLVLSNAAECSRQSLPDGRKSVSFARTIKMSTYLVAFVVGPLEVGATAEVDGVALRVIAPPGRAAMTGFAAEVASFSLRYLSDWYGIAYPGDKVDLIAIPDFAFGAMENLGCITFRETALLVDPAAATQAEQQRVADVIAHELAHMWFGDLVTMDWWNGIWLNEAFATFMEVLTVDAFRPEWERWVDFGTARSMAFDTDSLTSTRPIEYEVVTAEDAEAMFDVLTYEKGASVVRMLQQYLGEDRFQAGIRHYLRTHAYGNTDTTDLWDAIEESSGEPVRQLMDSWIFQAGHPVVTVETDGSTVSMHREMFSFRADPASGVRSPAVSSHQVPVLVRTATGAQHTVQRVLLDDEATVDLPGSPDWIVANHGGHGFYRVALSDHDLHRVVAHAATSLSPLERYGLAEDEWALLLSGRGSLDRVLTVVRALAGDPDLSVCQRVVGVLGSLDRLVPSSAADGYASFCRGLISPALVASGPEPVTGESERTTARRATLFDASARFGRDRAQLDLARERFALLGSPSGAPTLGPDLADAVVRVVASTANRDTWNELRRRAQSSTTPQDRLRHQGALADSADPDLVVELAALTLSDEIRTQDGPFILRRALSNRHAHQQVWAFVEDRWDEIAARFPSTTVPRLLDGVRPVTDRALASRIASFVEDHPLGQGDKVVSQHLERMWVTVALAEAMGGPLEQHFG